MNGPRGVITILLDRFGRVAWDTRRAEDFEGCDASPASFDQDGH